MPPTRTAPIAFWLPALLGFLIAVGPAATDMYLPAFPAVEASFHSAPGTAQLTLAPWFAGLAAFRAVAAFAASASMVIPRAVVRDLADGHAAAIMMSRLMLVMGAAPILAPSIGGLVLLFAHWRFIFVILAVYGATACALVWRFLPETLGPDRRIRLNLGEQLVR